jgi:CBS domain-containing protein
MSESQRASERRRCREIMTQNVTTAQPGMTLREAAQIMREGDMGALPVTEGGKPNGKLLGILTDRDIVVRAVAAGLDTAAAKVADAMTAELFTAAPDTPVFEAIRLMGDKQVRRIPVVDENGALEGIVSMADIALEMEDEREIAEALEEISSGKAFWRK